MIEHNIINVINLEHRTDRLSLFHQQSIEQGFGYRVWPGIIVKHNNKMGINRAHKQIVQYAKDNMLRYVCVAEDDIKFFAPGAWKYFLDNIPDDYDIYFSMIYNGQIENNRIMSVFSGMSMYIVNWRFYETFLSLPDDCHIDRDMIGGITDKYKFMVCDNFVCEQIGGKSDNTKTSIDSYRPFLVGRKIFGDVKMD